MSKMEDDYCYSQKLFAEDELNDMYKDSLLEGNSDYPMQCPEPPSSGLLLGVQPSLFGVEINDSDLDMDPGFLDNIIISESEGSEKYLLSNLDVNIPLNGVGSATGCGRGNDAVFPGDEIGTATRSDAREDAYEMPGMLMPTNEEILFRNWPGEYQFKVEPLLDSENKAVKKKAIYSSEKGKLFCTTDTAVPFKFELAYDRIKKPEDFIIKAFLAYEDNDVIGKAVLRCSTHIEKERSITDKSQMSRLAHMMRPMPLGDMKYFQNDVSKRCYLLIPVKSPEPGMSFTTRSYCFTCRNSCNVLEIEGKSRRAISIIFCMMDMGSGMVVGRSSIRLRVCSAPVRDFLKEEKVVSDKVVNNKRRSGELDLDDLPPAKQLNLGLGSSEIPLSMAHVNDAGMVELPYFQIEPTIRSVVRGSITGRPEDDGVSSSQETVFSSDETEHRIQLREVVRDIRWALQQKKSSNPILRSFSSNVFCALKLIEDLCKNARSVERQGKVAETSPDGGYHDHPQD